MHHHLFPTEDTYITNLAGFEAKNFGITEILRIGTFKQDVREFVQTQTFALISQSVVGFCLFGFTGLFSGSFSGSAVGANGFITSSAWFSSSYFSGSVNGGAITEISGLVSGSVNGTVTGSLAPALYIGAFNGSLTGSTGNFTGLIISGSEVINQPHYETITTTFADRSLIRFDLGWISASIAAGTIVNPTFKLNLKVANEYQLPITYQIYAFPVSQSWDMGNGFWSDGGSDSGVSWFYTDENGGNPWFSPLTSSARPVVDFFNTASNATGSWAYGGGTWYYTDGIINMVTTQSFAYESSDISMDVSNIVNAWLSGLLPNNGFILMSSDEIQNVGTGFSLSFYSRDTNTISYPYLDVAWDDSTFSTGSIFTSSVSVATSSAGGSGSVQSGSSINIIGGISGSFSGSSFLVTTANFVTASNAMFSGLFAQEFTGSISGSVAGTASFGSGTITNGFNLSFYTDYFSGSINGGPIVQIATSSISGSDIEGFISGSFSASVNQPISLFSGSLTGSFILSGLGSGTYIDTAFYAWSGFLNCIGTSGNIVNDPVFGNAFGLLSIANYSVVLPQDIIVLNAIESNEAPYTTGFRIPNSNSPFNELIDVFFDFEGDEWTIELPLIPVMPITESCSPMHVVQTIIGTFNTGPWSGSSFIGYYSNFGILMATLSGSLSLANLFGTSVIIPLPSGIDPYAYAYFTGPYVNGTALGLYMLSGSTSASFNGQFVNGDLLGAYVDVQLSGSFLTSSLSFTSSVISSSVFAPLNTNTPFTIIIKDLKPTYKGGDIPQIGVFARPQFPLKVFEKTAQQSVLIVPELLPTSSYYAIKDNMSEEMIVDFDNYTKLSCAYPYGNFFMLDTTGLAEERSYRVLIRVENSGSKYTFDDGNVFKITR